MVALYRLAQALVVPGVQGGWPEHHLLPKLPFALQDHKPGVFNQRTVIQHRKGGIGCRHTAAPHLQRSVVEHLEESGLLRPAVQVAVV